ncbi:MAG: peptidoglycan DD-metalloendopeptidase family protein [Bacteroidales bacterium]|nr:peptidoglycan DD-metalloendopeptidase family protein [Bacteroidales bacterium]
MLLAKLCNKVSTRLFAVVLVAIFFVASSFDVHAQDRNKLEKQKAKLEKEISSMNAILKETKKTKKMSTSELQILKKKIASRQRLINNISSQMGMLNNEIKSTQKSIGELCNEIEVLKESYAQMLRYAQRNKTATDKLLFIFSAKDYKEAYQRYIFFRQFGEMQRKKLAQIQEKTAELSKRTGELETKISSQQSLLQQELKNNEALNKEKTQKEKAVKNLQKKEKQLAQNLKKKQDEVKKLQRQIDAAIAAEVEKQRKLAEEKKKKMNEQAKSSSANKQEVAANKAAMETAKKKNYTIATTPEEVALSNKFETNKGKLPWPSSQGVIVSQYGVHAHPEIKGTQIENKGIDIRTTKGSAIRAVFSGEVSRVAKGPAGMVVIIRHGEYMTVYANLKSVSVKTGTKVTTKQTIGVVNTNEDGVSEYKFQIFKGTHHLNPSVWLSK